MINTFLKFLLVFFAVFFFAATANAYDLKSQPAYSLLMQSQEALLKRDRKSGEVLIQEIQNRFPNDPFASFGTMVSLQNLIFENADETFVPQFEMAAEENKKICAPIFKDEQADLFKLYICGAGSGVMSFESLRNKSYFKSLSQASQARAAMQGIIARDPTFYDAYMAVGMYQFWRSHFTKKFAFLPFFRDQSQEGIKNIQVTINQGDIAKTLAQASLIIVYYGQKNYELSLKEADALLSRYPNNVALRVLKLADFTELKKWNEYIFEVDRILKIDPQLSVYDYLAGKVLFYKLNQPGQAKLRLEKVLNHPNKMIARNAQKILESIAQRK